MEKVVKRLREPSTYAGIAAIVAGVGQVGHINEAATVADVVASQGPGIGMFLAGIFAMFLPEKGKS